MQLLFLPPTNVCDLLILLTSTQKPTLHEEGELAFVNADSVQAVIEVKTKVLCSGKENMRIEAVLKKLADNVEVIRRSCPQTDCLAGLFVFEDSNVKDQTVLKSLHAASQGEENRVINLVSIGTNRFFRFWSEGRAVRSEINEAVWHSYSLDDLAPSYFINNIVVELSEGISNESEDSWFPIPGTKETMRKSYISLKGEIGNLKPLSTE